MLFTIAVILFSAWLLGLVGTYNIGAFVHVCRSSQSCSWSWR
jgi:hypothetical protein